MIKSRFSLFLITFLQLANLPAQSILFYVSHEQTYYSEYIVMHEALSASGYTVDVRSASNDSASTYMIPAGTDISATAGTLPGGSYSQFTSQFQDLFGTVWNTSLNITPNYIPVNGRIQDVIDMSGYDALVIAGGTGALEYRVDGSYNSQGVGPRLISAATVQEASEKLNALALEALADGKPVMAQCHGASLPVYWRIPSTFGPGEETMGYSLLKDHFATGFPDAQTPIYLSGLNVNHRAEDRVTISSPHNSFNDDDLGEFRIITTRDWYPQTIAHAARTLINIIETYPSEPEMTNNVSVLILHGGIIDTTNCGPGNISNDVPCNYGGTPNFPADYTYIETLLNANSTNDNYNFTVSNLNLTGTLPYDPNDETSILNYLDQYEVIIFYKHWATGMNDILQNAIVKYADNGGGVLALHHGLYGHTYGIGNKNILINNLFGAESAQATWSGDLANYNLINTNYGHFISTYGISYPSPSLAPGVWGSNPPMGVANNSFSYLQRFPIYDEIYNNMSFVAGETFGRNVNDITPIFSNDYTTASQCHTAGFVKLFDEDLNGLVGRVAYYEAGERRESINMNHLYGQVLRNTIVWTASSGPLPPNSVEPHGKNYLSIHPNPVNDFAIIQLPVKTNGNAVIQILSISGQPIISYKTTLNDGSITLNTTAITPGIYLVNVLADDHRFTARMIKCF